MGTNGEPTHPAAGGPWPELPMLGAGDLDDEVGDDDADELEEEGGGFGENPRLVLITGASGNIGRKLRAAWAGMYDLVLIDSAADGSDPDVEAADLSEFDEGWADLFEGVDTVVHLAANPNEFAPWPELQGPNLDTVANVLHAAALAGVDRFVFASSNHAMGGYRDRGDEPLDEDLPPLPGNAYGATKLMGERLGRACSSAFDLDFIALRLGWVQPGANRPETLPDDWSRGLWLSDADCARLFTRAIEVDLGSVSFAVVNGTSRNRGSRWPLDRAETLLGYIPEDGIAD